jgi:hypothetical protein
MPIYIVDKNSTALLLDPISQLLFMVILILEIIILHSIHSDFDGFFLILIFEGHCQNILLYLRRLGGVLRLYGGRR